MSKIDLRPLVAVAADRRLIDGHAWHAAYEPYLVALARVSGCVPLIVPALADVEDVRAVLEAVDGVLLTGSRSNVHPARYGIPASPRHEPYDEARDETSLALIEASRAAQVPLFAICRGMQELNVALGGTLAADIQEMPGRMDHRAPEGKPQDERFAPAHDVQPVPGGRLAALLGDAPVHVNSVHRQAIDRLAPGLAVEAEAVDGTVEAVSFASRSGFALGVQWHPEYWAESDQPSRRLFEAFGEAVRARRAARLRLAQPA